MGMMVYILGSPKFLTSTLSGVVVFWYLFIIFSKMMRECMSNKTKCVMARKLCVTSRLQFLKFHIIYIFVKLFLFSFFVKFHVISKFYVFQQVKTYGYNIYHIFIFATLEFSDKVVLSWNFLHFQDFTLGISEFFWLTS